LARFSILPVLVCCLCACVSTKHSSRLTESAPDAEIAAEDVAWRFDFIDTAGSSMGFMVLVFTDEKIDEPTCGNDNWARMIILEDALDIDFGVDPRPAYSLRGSWLRIDLTASVCYLNHNLIGDISPEGASGYFTLTHKIGGRYIGKFTASPVSQVTKDY